MSQRRRQSPAPGHTDYGTTHPGLWSSLRGTFLPRTASLVVALVLASVACPARAAKLAAGSAHTCALTKFGGARCWGADDNGQLGDGGTNSDKQTPVAVVGLSSGVKTIAAARKHTCAVTMLGGAWCWGDDAYGQLGDGGTNSDKPTPVAVVGLSSGVKDIAAGSYHTCALTAAGAVKCWGQDANGQVGDGIASNAEKPTPVAVSGLSSGVKAIDAGVEHTCALTTAGAVKCWGVNTWGQVGDGTTQNYRSTPVAVVGLSSGVKAIAVGGEYTCALTTAGAVKCWGSDFNGQVGDGGSNSVTPTPVAVSGLPLGVKEIAAGGKHTCALTPIGAVRSWGSDSDGQLGDGGTNTDKPTPVYVVGFP